MSEIRKILHILFCTTAFICQPGLMSGRPVVGSGVPVVEGDVGRIAVVDGSDVEGMGDDA